MFLVKSCKKKDNVLQSKTIKIGTLHEYRKTESLQILDIEEGFYRISIDFQNKAISVDYLNLLNSSSNSLMDSHIDYASFCPALLGRVMTSLKAQHTIKNNNRFIFCMSKLDHPKESTSLFPDYDSYWHMDFQHNDEFIEKLEVIFLEEIKMRIAKGEKIFSKDKINLKKLKIKTHYQEIIYTERALHIDNENLFSMREKLIGIFNDIKYIKPIDFQREREFRIVFDFYEGDRLLIPIVEKIIIPFEAIDGIQDGVI